jgi:hypothetical protein
MMCFVRDVCPVVMVYVVCVDEGEAVLLNLCGEEEALTTRRHREYGAVGRCKSPARRDGYDADARVSGELRDWQNSRPSTGGANPDRAWAATVGCSLA